MTPQSPDPARWIADVLALDDVQLRPMFGCPAFFSAGRMFACVVDDDVGLKLPASRVEALLDQPGFTHFTPYGKPPMRQWVQLNLGTGLAPIAGPLVREALAFVTGGAR